MPNNPYYQEQRDAILSNPGTHYWTKNAILELENRDLCDVLGDLELLTTLFSARMSALQERRDETPATERG